MYPLTQLELDYSPYALQLLIFCIPSSLCPLRITTLMDAPKARYFECNFGSQARYPDEIDQRSLRLRASGTVGSSVES